MIDEFDQEHLKRRQKFLKNRAVAHLMRDQRLSWHRAAAATMYRDAAAVALMSNEIDQGRDFLMKSGNLFFSLGFSAGLQLLYISGAFEADEAVQQIKIFRQAYLSRDSENDFPISAEASVRFDEQSFEPPQLFRAYQALAGRIASDDESYGFRGQIHKRLSMNAAMPVGPNRAPLATYLDAFDQLIRLDTSIAKQPTEELLQILNSFAQRREEGLSAARRDRFHWNALLRPAEFIDFDLLALLLAGTRRRHGGRLISDAFGHREPLTALPQALARALAE